MVLKLGILASGRGSDFQAILDHVKMGILQNVAIEALVCNVENAFVIERAKNQGIGTNFIQGSAGMKFESNNEREKFREDFDSKIIEIFNKKDIDLVVCAGFNQIISNVLVKEFTNKILNIHPAYDVKRFGGYGMVGMKVHESVIKEREEISGCTVHYIDSTVDRGPILLQAKVPVYENDSAELLSERVLVIEHRTYPKAIQLHVDGRVKINDNKADVDLRSENWENKWNKNQIKYCLYQRDEWKKQGKDLAKILHPDL